MRTTSFTNRFRKDLKRESRGLYRHKLKERLQEALLLLQTDQLLPARFCDHALTGVWNGYRDCHLFPDLVLIYSKAQNSVLELIRLGSHSELDL